MYDAETDRWNDDGGYCPPADHYRTERDEAEPRCARDIIEQRAKSEVTR